MRLRSLYEGVRMGSSDLSIPPKKDYTIGFEFEVALRNNIDTYSDIDDTESDDFEPEFDATAFMKQWVNDNILNSGDTVKFITENDITPRYGYTSNANDDDITDMQIKFDDDLIEKYGEDIVDEIQDLLLDLKEDPDLELDDDQIHTIIEVYLKIQDKTPNEERIKNIINKQLKDNNDAKAALAKQIQVLNDTFLFDDSSINNNTTEIYTDSRKSQTIDIQDLSDISELIDYFDISLSDIDHILYTSPEYTYEEDLETELEATSDGLTNNTIQTDALRFVRNTIAGELKTVVLKDASDTEWSVGEDGTSGVDAEIRSPVLPLHRGLNDMNRVFDIIRDTDMYTNEATGLHINIGTWSESEYQTVDWLKFLTILNPGRILQQFSRSNNQYALDRVPALINSLKYDDFKYYSEMVKNINNTVINTSVKMSSVNLSKLPSYGYIELRAPGNTGYEHRGDEITALVRKIVRCLELASDPSAYKNQYLKKLYTLSGTIAPKNFMFTNINELFTQLADTPFNKSKPFNSINQAFEHINDVIIKQIDKALTTNIISELINSIKTSIPDNPHELSAMLEVDDMLSKGFIPQNSKLVKILKRLIETIKQTQSR